MMEMMFCPGYNVGMQSSKTSKQSRKKASDAPAATAETAPVKESKTTARTARTSQSKKAVDPVPAAAKSHRKPSAKTSEANVTAPPKVMAAAAGSTVAITADPVGPMAAPANLPHEEVAKLAYSYWIERNREHGYAEHDWHRAIHELTQTR